MTLQDMKMILVGYKNYFISSKYMKVLVTGGSGMVGYGIKSIKNTYNYGFNFLSSSIFLSHPFTN